MMFVERMGAGSREVLKNAPGKIRLDKVVEREGPGGHCKGCCGLWGGRGFVGKHQCKPFLGFISLSPTSSLLKHFAIKRFWSGLFSALCLHPELH